MTATKFQGVKGDAVGEGALAATLAAGAGLLPWAALFVEAVSQATEMVRLNPAATAERFQGVGVVDAGHTAFSMDESPDLKVGLGQFQDTQQGRRSPDRGRI